MAEYLYTVAVLRSLQIYSLSNKTGAVTDKCLCCWWLHVYKTVI